MALQVFCRLCCVFSIFIFGLLKRSCVVIYTFFSPLPSVQSLVMWEENKLVCKQIGEKKNRGWAHWIEEDKLHLVRMWAINHICSFIFLYFFND